jgi:hypothetical protein
MTTLRISIHDYWIQNNALFGWYTNRNYDREMTFLETPIAIPVHLAGSVMICCWIDIMETVLSFLVQNCLLRYIIIFALHWLASVSS